MTGNLLLMPDQMMLQIHESIGHPLELDRILRQASMQVPALRTRYVPEFQYGSKS